MSGAIDVLKPEQPKRVLIVASNEAVSAQTGWPIGFWWAELTHPYWASPKHAALVEKSLALAEVDPAGYDAVFLVGGQGPMYTFFDDERIHRLVADHYQAGKVTAVVCHATCVLLKTRLADGRLLVDGKTWTGFANSEEDYADDFVGRRIQPFRIEDEARKLAGTNFIVQGRFKAHAVRDGNLITGQQQYSGAAAARLVIHALGV